MTRILHDLTATEDRRFSPYCWRTKLALAHKGLDFESRPVRFIDIDGLDDGPRLTLPTLDDDGLRVTDSWAIAEHLEAKYREAPSLFPTGRQLARFVQAWTNAQVQPAMLRIVLMDVYNALDADTQPYFRESREARFSKPLEEIAGDPAAATAAFRQTLSPLRVHLAEQPFVAGDAPAYADHIVAGVFLWAEAVGRADILAADDPVAQWLDRVRPAG